MCPEAVLQRKLYLARRWVSSSLFGTERDGGSYLHDSSFSEVILLLVRTTVITKSPLFPVVWVLGSLFGSLPFLPCCTALRQQFQAVIAFCHHASFDIREDRFPWDTIPAFNA